MAKRISKKAHFQKRARNQRNAAKSEKVGARKAARLQIAHGYDLLAKHSKNR